MDMGLTQLPRPPADHHEPLRCRGRRAWAWPARTLALAAALAAGLGLAATLEPVEVTLLQTTDLHAYLEGSDHLPEGGGWLRLATLIRREREARGADRLLLIDCGDSCQGTLEALVSHGQVGVDLVNALEYDVWVPGNHELDFGVARARELCREAEPRLLCGNLSLTPDGRPFRAWRLFERAGLRIAVVGATASHLSQWLWGTTMEGYRVESAVDMLSRVMPEIMAADPDILVLAIHQGWMEKDPRGVNEIPRIVELFPQIDVIVGGHTHREIAGLRLGRSTWYVQAGYDAAALALIEILFDPNERAVLNTTSRLVQADAGTPLDAAARRAVQPHLERAAAVAASAVGNLAVPVTGGGQPGETCGTSELICQAIAERTGATAVLHGRLTSAGLGDGAVTETALFAVIPFENSVATAKLSAAELREVVQEQTASRTSSAYCGPWGLQVTLDSAGTQVVDVRLADGSPLPEDRRLTVAINSYTAAGAGGRFPRLQDLLRQPEVAAHDTGLNSRDVLRDYLREHPGLRLEPRRWVTKAPAP